MKHFCVAFCIFCLACWASAAAVPAAVPARQWRPVELTLTAATEIPDPFDFVRAKFSAAFAGPAGEQLEVPGFWDGGRSWKIRFTPTAPGAWSYATRFSDTGDAGLHGQRGALDVQGADGEGLHRHGGFLKLSADGHYLTYTDGTPFFWLGDTWWAAPAENVPFDAFRRQVEARVAQGYTVYQAHGHRPLFADTQLGALEATRHADAETLRYWRETDRYIACGDEHGLLGMLGFARGDLLDALSLNDLERLWHYYIARYSAYAVGFLITQEYNIEPDKRPTQIPKMLALGQFIKDTDPWKRALTAHPWARSRDLRQAWGAPWFDFILLQAGHRRFESASSYQDIWQRPAPKPCIESEANYEGFAATNFNVNAAAIRRSAYTALQAGSCGFTYGAQGLYAGIQDRAKPGPTAKWGPVLSSEEGLALAGGAQLQHLRACYESVAWWRLRPLAAALEPAAPAVLVKAEPPDTYLLYYVAAQQPAPARRLKGVPAGARYAAHWFDPRTGQSDTLAPLVSQGTALLLPPRPDAQDWMLILKRQQ